jgi:hypothetical protein
MKKIVKTGSKTAKNRSAKSATTSTTFIPIFLITRSQTVPRIK